MHVLVTGGCGFIGQHLCRRLLADGHTVTVLDDLSTGRAENLPTHVRLTLVTGSVLDGRTVREAATGADFVFHLANVVGMKRVHEDPDQTYRVSVDGTENVLRQTGNAPVVIFSSSAVYGFAAEQAVREDSAVLDDPGRFEGMGLSGYANGKWMMEALGQEAARRGRPVLILRPFNVVGPGQTNEYGMVLPTFVKQAKRGEALTVYDDGRQRRCFGDVRTAVDCILQLCERGPDSPEENVFNIGNPTETSILGLAEMVIECVGRGSIRFMPYASVFPDSADVRRRIPDISRLESVIGKVQWADLREVIRELDEVMESGLATAGVTE